MLLEDLRYEPESDTVVQKQKGPDGSIQWKGYPEGDFATLEEDWAPRQRRLVEQHFLGPLSPKSEVEGTWIWTG